MGGERHHHHSSAQEYVYSSGAHGQGSPENRIQLTWRLLRESWNSSRGTVRLPAPTPDNRCEICRAQTAGIGTNKQHFNRGLLYQSGIR